MIVFTRHAVDRYIDFHAIGDAQMTPERARTLLESHGGAATRLKERSHAGDDMWEIPALGILIVTKHDAGLDICVTVLPPGRFRGLTPEQAEGIERLAARAAAVSEELAQATAVLSQAVAEPAKQQVDRDRLSELRLDASILHAQRDLLGPILRTLRMAQASEDRRTKKALRTALQFIARLPAEETLEVLGQIRAHDPGFVSEAFIHPTRKATSMSEHQDQGPPEMRAADPDAMKAHQLHGRDTRLQVFIYETEFYPLSNFSAFRLDWKGLTFDTSEAAYQWEKFTTSDGAAARVRESIHRARSAHEAFQVARNAQHLVRPDWDEIKITVMRDILRAKCYQHEYVRRKLAETGDRTIVEDSWRDAFWGWGPNRDGRNELGGLWMQIRSEMHKGKP